MTVVLTTNHQPQSVRSHPSENSQDSCQEGGQEGSPRLRGAGGPLGRPGPGLLALSAIDPKARQLEHGHAVQKHATCTNRYFLDWVLSLQDTNAELLPVL